MSATKVSAPWNDDHCHLLNAHQKSGAFQVYTCPRPGCKEVLVAMTGGWFCPDHGTVQTWCFLSHLRQSWSGG